MTLARTARTAAALAGSTLRWNWPAFAVLFVTDRCNARCRFCFNSRVAGADAAVGEELSLVEYRTIARGLKPLFDLTLSGGEPMLRDDLAEIILAFHREAGVRLISLPTNGMLPGRVREVVRRIAASCAGATINVMVSIDAAGARHDELRGVAGAFDRAIESLEALLELELDLDNVNAVVNSVLSPETVDDFAGLRAHLRGAFGPRLRFHNVNLDQRQDTGSDAAWLDRAEALLDQMAAERADSGAGRLDRLVNRVYIDALNALLLEQARGHHDHRCVAGRKMLVLLPDGRAAPCEPFLFEPMHQGLPVVNIRDAGLDYRRLMRDPRFQTLQRAARTGPCGSCSWSCATITSMIHEPRNWPLLCSRACCRGGAS